MEPLRLHGLPQFADGETGVLFPLHFLALSTGHVEWLLLWGPVIRSLLAALAAYWLAHSLRISPAGAAITGLAFGLGSFAVAQQHHLNVANSVFVLPAMLASAECALSTVSARKRLGCFALGGMFFALALVGVHPQIVTITGLGVALHLFLSLATDRWRAANPGWRSRVGWVIGGGSIMLLAGLGLGALQAVPLYELITQSLRGVTLSDVEASRFAVLPVATVQLLFPGIFGSGEQFWGAWNRWETSLYLGALPLSLGVLAFLRRPVRRVVWVLAAIAVLTWLFAQGSHGPTGLYDGLRHIPGFDRARAPGRFTLIVLMNLAVLAGIGLDSLRARRLSWRWPAGIAAFLTLAWLALLAFNVRLDSDLGARFDAAAWAERLPGSSALTAARSTDELIIASTDPWMVGNWLPVLVAILGMTLIAVLIRRPISPNLLAPALLILASFELIYFAATFHPRLPLQAVFDPPLDLDAASEPGTFPRTVLLNDILDGSNYLLTSEIAESSGYASLVPRRQTALLEAWNRAPARFSRLLGAARVLYSTDSQRGFDVHFADAYGVSYSILRPAAVLDSGSPVGDGLVDLSGAVPDRLLAVVSMDGGTDVPQGTAVATVSWMHDGNVVTTTELRAGLEVSERIGFGALAFRSPAHSEAAGPAIVVGCSRDNLYHRVQFTAPARPPGGCRRISGCSRRPTIDSARPRSGRARPRVAPALDSTPRDFRRRPANSCSGPSIPVIVSSSTPASSSPPDPTTPSRSSSDAIPATGSGPSSKPATGPPASPPLSSAPPTHLPPLPSSPARLPPASSSAPTQPNPECSSSATPTIGVGGPTWTVSKLPSSLPTWPAAESPSLPAPTRSSSNTTHPPCASEPSSPPSPSPCSLSLDCPSGAGPT